MARVDDHTPDLWTPSFFETAAAEVAALWEHEKKKGPAAEPSLETFTRIAEKAVAPVLTLFRLNPFASKTDEIDEEFDRWNEASDQWYLGDASLAEKDYGNAIKAYENALTLDLDNPNALLIWQDLGKARFGLKDFKGSREAYGVALALASRHDETRRLHLEASQKYLGTLDQKKDAKEIAVVEKDIVADQAMLVALEADKERRGIKELGRELSKSSPQSPDEAKKILDQVNSLAQNYLVYGSADFFDPKDTEFVRGEFNALAAEAFQVLCSLSSTSVYEEIRKRTPLYEGYFFLTEGNVDLASEKFEKVREEIPEADEILKRLAEDRIRASKQVEVNRFRSINLAVLDAWEAYIEEGTAVEVDQVNGWLGQGLQLVGGQNETSVRSRWEIDVTMVALIRRRIKSGKFETVHAALEEMAQEDDRWGKRARALLENEWDGSRNGSYLIEHLIAYASNLESKEDLENQLLDDADQTNARYGAAQTPSWVYAILQETASNGAHKELAEQRIEELKNGKGLGEQIWDMIRTAGTDDLVQIALMAGASKVGSLTKFAALNRLQKMRITGYKAVLLAGGAEVLAEGTTLWALNTLHESATHDVNKVFSADHLLKSYGATLVMLPFIKLSSAGGKNAGTSLARRLGMIAEGGSPLSRWGKVFAGGVTHTFGAGGMVAASQTNQGLQLVPVAPGGFKGTLVHEVFGYAKYAFAGGAFHKALGAKHAEAHEKLQNDIAIKKAAVLAEGHLKAIGHRASSRGKDGSPVFEASEAQDLYGQMIFLSLSRQGFNGGKVSQLLAQGKRSAAETYLQSFGLKPKFGGAKNKLVGLEELSHHKELGITLGDGEGQQVPVLAREATEVISTEQPQQSATPFEKADPSGQRPGTNRPDEPTNAESPQANRGTTSLNSETGLRPLKFVLAKLEVEANRAASQNGGTPKLGIRLVRSDRTQEPLYFEVDVKDGAVKQEVLDALQQAGITYDPTIQRATVNGLAIEVKILPDTLLPNNAEGTHELGHLDVIIDNGEVAVRAREGELIVNGPDHKAKYEPGQAVYLEEGDTIQVGGEYYARIDGQLRRVPRPQVSPENLLDQGTEGMIFDNGDGTFTKVLKPNGLGIHLNGEHRALAYLQYFASKIVLNDFFPAFYGRPSPDQVVIGRVPGRDLANLSHKARQAIPDAAWERLFSDLKTMNEGGVSHNDITPRNILWDGKRLRLVDFSSAEVGMIRTHAASDLSRDVHMAKGIQKKIRIGVQDPAMLYSFPTGGRARRVRVEEIPFESSVPEAATARIPICFRTESQFREFSRTVMEELQNAGVPVVDAKGRPTGLQVVIHGSSVRGVDYRNGEPFRWDGSKPSDIDIAVIMPQDVFDTSVQRRIEASTGDQIGRDGDLRKMAKMIQNQGRLSSYHFDPELRRAHNRIRDAFPSRKIQISFVLPESTFAPSAQESIPLTAP